jgi:integrin alpha FG-GAP repeat containing protein 1
MCSQPLVADFNGDEIPDVLAKDCPNNSLKVWISVGWKRIFRMYPFKNYVEPDCLKIMSTISQSSMSLAFIDINQDLMADLIITSHTNSTVTVWSLIRSSDSSQFHCCNQVNVGHSSILPNASFTDFNADGSIDVLFPACSLSDNSDGTICVLLNKRLLKGCPEFESFNIDLQEVTGEKFPVHSGPIMVQHEPKVLIPTWIRMGDYDLDTYPDIVIVATILEGAQDHYKGFLLINSGCSSSHNCAGGRTLKHRHIQEFDSYYGDIRLSLFHDIDEDGDLDILLNVIKNGSSNQNAELVIATNRLDSDSNFLRVDILTAACIGNGTCKESPTYEVCQLGAMVGFSTTGPHGNDIRSVSGQVSKSGSFSCSLPYVIFGLSRSSNFVEHLVVGIPYVEGKGRAVKSWSSIIPNSHLYIVPQPSNHPSSWKNILLLNPSDKVWYTLAVFASICAVFGVVVGLLQWREKRQDEREKRQQAHKFHFDAM